MESRLAALAEASAHIFGAGSLQDTLRLITEAARDIVGAHQAVTSLSEGEALLQSIQHVSLSQKYAAWQSYEEKPTGKGIYQWAVRENRVMRFTQAELERHPHWRGFGEAKSRHPPMRGWLAVPMLARDGRNLGLIQLSDKHAGEFDSADEAIVVQLAQLAALAIENLRLVEAAQTAERRFQEFAACGSEVLWETDEQHRYTYISVRPGHVTALPVEQCYGMTRWELFHATPADPQWAAHLRDLDARKPFQDFEYSFAAADGAVHYRRSTGRPIFDAAGTFRGYRGATADISPQRRAEAAARASEERFREFAEIGADWLWETDRNHRFCNFGGARGTSDRRPLGATRWDLAKADLSSPQWRAHLEVLAARKPFRDFEYTLTHADGGVHHIQVSGNPLFDERGEFLGYRGTARDMTAQRTAEAAARAADDRYRNIVETTNEGVWILDSEARTTFVNRRMAEMLGYAEEELIGRSVYEFRFAEDMTGGQSRWRERREGRSEQREARFKRRDGTWFWALINAEPLYDAAAAFAGALGMVTDITGRKAAEEALRASEERFRHFAEIASDWIWEADAEHRFTFFSAGPRISRDPIGRRRWEIAEADTSRPPWSEHLAALDARKPFRNFEYSLVDREGRLRHISVNGQPVFAADGSYLGYRGTGTDLTAQREAEAAARKAAEQYRNVVESANEGIWIVDAEARFVYVNPCLARMFGREAEAMLGRSIFDFYLPEEREGRRKRWHEAKHLTRQQLVRRYVRSDGKVISGMINVSPLFDESGGFAGSLGMITDITARIEAEEALKFSEERFRQFAALGSDWLWETDAEHRIVFVDGPPTIAAGFALGKRRWEFGDVDPDRPEWKRHRRALALREPFRNFQYAISGTDGGKRHFSLSGEPMYDARGTFVGYRGTTTDITARRNAEDALRASEQKFRDFAEIASDWLWETDVDHRLLSITGRTGPIDDRPLGRTRWELCGQPPDHPQWRDHVADLEARRPFRDFEFTLRDRAGEERFLVANGRPKFDADGGFLGYRGTVTDRTAQRRAEAAAAEIGNKFRQIVETAHEGIWMIDMERRTTYCNPRLAEMLGYAPEEIIGRHHWDFMPPEERSRAMTYGERRDIDKIEQEEIRYRRKDGADRWFLITSNLLRDDSGTPVGLLGMLVDVTERRAAEAREAQAKREVESILASISDGFVALDNAWRFTYMNPAAERIVGRLATDAIGRNARDVIDASDGNVFAECYAAAKAGNQSVAFTAWSENFGAWLEIRAYPHAEGLTIFFRDVSAERHSHVALARSERELMAALEQNRTILESISDGFAALDNDWRFTYVNRAAERIWKARADDIIGKSLLHDMGLEADNPFVSCYLESKREDQPVAFAAPSNIHGLWLEVRGYPHPGGYTWFFHDVTEERNAHLELVASRKHLDTAREINNRLFETSLDLICITDSYGRFVQVNPGASTEFGYTADEMVGRNAGDYVHPEDVATTREAMQKTREAQGARNFENRCRRADGKYIPINWSIVWSEAERKYFLIGRDMTERVEAQEQLNRAQRLQAIGQLTGGIAHDFNNLLTVIMGNADILGQALKDQAKLRRHADLTLAAARRAAELTAQLLAFARRQTLAPGVIDPNQLVGGLKELMQRTLGAHIEIRYALDPAAWRCRVDATQLESALLNLAVNARDAMGEGGRLTFATYNRSVGAGEAKELAAGDYVAIAVSDTGTGMTPEVLARAVEPFFTTKDVGKGSGLGLAMAYGFAKQSGGHLAIASEPGRGTTVTIHLPRTADGANAAAASRDAAAGEMPRGGETVLLVEDDAAVRDLATYMLSGLGYRVVAAGNGVEARGMLDRMERLDLLFTDVMMPGGISGTQLAEDAARLRPGLKILFTSGYTDAGAASPAGRLPPALLQKPYKMADLARAVRGVLDGAA